MSIYIKTVEESKHSECFEDNTSLQDLALRRKDMISNGIRKTTQRSCIPKLKNSPEDFSHLDLSNRNLRNSNFSQTCLFNTSLVNSNLLGTTLGIDWMLLNSLDNVLSMEYSQDGKYLYKGNHSGSIRISDFTNGLCQKYDRNLVFFSNILFSFSPNKNLFAIASNGNCVQVWEVKSGEKLLEFQDFRYFFLCVAFSANEKLVAAGDKKGNIVFYDILKQKRIKNLNGHKREVTCLAFSPDKLILASGSSDSSLKLWKLKSMKKHHEMKIHKGKITALGFSGDGQYLCSSSEDCTINIWTVKTGKLFRTFRVNNIANAEKIAFSLNAAYVAVPMLDDSIEILEVHSAKVLHKIPCKSTKLNCLTISPDSKYIACIIEQKHVIIWEVMRHPCLYTVEKFSESPVKSFVSPNARYIANLYRNETICVKELNGSQFEGKIEIEGYSASTRLFFSSDSLFMCILNENLNLEVWDLVSGTMVNNVKEREIHNCKVYLIANEAKPLFYNLCGQKRVMITMHENLAHFASKNRVILSIGATNELIVYNTDSGNIRYFETTDHPAHWFKKLIVSTDNQLLSWIFPDKTVAVWQFKGSCKLYFSLKKEYKTTDLAMSPDNRFLIAQSYYGTVRVWDIIRIGVVQEFNLRNSLTDTIEVLSDGDHFRLINSDKQILIFKIKRQRMDNL